MSHRGLPRVVDDDEEVNDDFADGSRPGLRAFQDGFALVVKKDTEDYMEFDMIGCSPALVAAMRRILIADVPTVAVEDVYVVENSSQVHSDMLVQRLGLVPIAVDARQLDFRSAGDAATEKNTVVFKLDVCFGEQDGKNVGQPQVTSGQLEWLAAGSERPDETATRFAAAQQLRQPKHPGPPKPAHDDITLAKLGPGERVALEAHCIKGVGRTHAKWSPVAPAWFYLHPAIELVKPVPDDVAGMLIAKSPTVFDRDDDGELRAKCPRELEELRELLNSGDGHKYVKITHIEDHYIFKIETAGAYAPRALLEQAIDILHDKAQRLADAVSEEM